MAGLEILANLFDQLHDDNKRNLKLEFQSWVNNIYRSEGETWRFYGAAGTAAGAEALYTFAGGVASGFVDVLRIGQGIASGTLGGLAQDGLRSSPSRAAFSAFFEWPPLPCWRWVVR